MAASPGEGKKPPLQLADLDEAIERLPESERTSLFSDTVHFGASGYDLFGDLAYKAITGKAAGDLAYKASARKTPRTTLSQAPPVPEGIRTATVSCRAGAWS